MKIFSFIFLASVLLIFPQAQQDSPELKEASALTESALKLFSEQKYDEALSHAKKAFETGKVISAKDMCGGPQYLSQSCVASALEARFTPTKLSGMPIKVSGVIQYHFVRQ